MNKRGANKLFNFLIIVGIIVLIFFISFSVYKYLKPIETKGAVFKAGEYAEKKLDPFFEYLFGKDFKASFNWLIGKRTGLEAFGSFFAHMLLGFFAVLWLAVAGLIINLIKRVFRIKTLGVRTGFGVSLLRYIGLIIIYPTLMEIAVLNRFIEIITFYYFTNWLIQSLILAIYVGFLPDIIEAIIHYIEYTKAQKAIFETAAGAQILRAAGKTK